MVNLPGQLANTFQFTVRTDSLAAVIEQDEGPRVSLTYEQHKGVPTSCFGETEYFVNGVRAVGVSRLRRAEGPVARSNSSGF